MYQLIEKSGWKLAKFRYLPVTSRPVNYSIFRTEASGKILLEAPPIPPHRSFQLNIAQCIPYVYRQLQR